jgi:predicted CXXCH cytochrome family protein
MNCDTVEMYDSEGNPILKPKKRYETLDDAIEVAKKINAQDHVIHKVVAYKCPDCHKYHIGRNGKQLKEKDREKFKKHENQKWTDFKNKLKFN